MSIDDHKSIPTKQLFGQGQSIEEIGLADNSDSCVALGDLVASRYEVLESIGSGGMGQVFKVSDRSLNGEISALKLLSPNLAKEKQYFQRFRNEVILARRLAHPNIVRIFDFGAAGHGYHYISMEYVEGKDLRSVMLDSKSSRLELAEAAKLVFDISLALDYSHRMEIIHRDLKPDNVLLSKKGIVKLVDFGSARMIKVDQSITSTGELIGTPHYMAPELFRGEKPTPLVDVYSLGIVLYELVCGKLPFIDESVLGVITKHLNHPVPSVINSRADFPQWFEDVVQTCTEKNPAHRFASVAELAEVLCDKLCEMGAPPRTACVPHTLKWKAEVRKKLWGMF